MGATKRFSNEVWWMQFDSKVWVSNPTILAMTDREYRTYFQLLNYQWNDSTCTLPADPKKLAQMSGVYLSCLKADGVVMQQFEFDEGRIFNRKLLKARAESAEVSIRNTVNGKKGGRPKSKTDVKTQPITDAEPGPHEEETHSKASNNNNNNYINNQIQNQYLDLDKKWFNPDPDPVPSPPPAPEWDQSRSKPGPHPVETGQCEPTPISTILENMNRGMEGGGKP